jgi:hypothetical protein
MSELETLRALRKIQKEEEKLLESLLLLTVSIAETSKKIKDAAMYRESLVMKLTELRGVTCPV